MDGRTGCHVARGCAVIDKGNETWVRVPKQGYQDRANEATEKASLVRVRFPVTGQVHLSHLGKWT
jgi:hypothetical protein